MFRDPYEEKKTLKEVTDEFRVAYNGLAEKYVLGRKRCIRPKPDYFRLTPKDCEDEKKIKEFEQALENLIRKLDLEEEIGNLLLESKKKKSREVVPKKIEYPTKLLPRCDSNYDWNYVNYYANDDITSPSGVSLRSVSSYYVLPAYPDQGEPVKSHEEPPPLPCEYDFIHMPRNQRGKFVRKTLPISKKEQFQEEIANLLQQFQTFRKKKREMGCGSFIPRLGVKNMLLIDKINLGYVPDMDDRADLISLFEKIRPKKEEKRKKENASREEVCLDFVPTKTLKYYRPNNGRQVAVLKRYTPKDHEDLDVIDRRRRGIRKLARINRGYYGSGPTLWKCNRVDDTWYTEGELDEYKCTEEPCTCPIKPKDEISKKKKELAHPTFLALTADEKETLKESWKNRGINKSTLAMMWFTKLFKANAEEIVEQNHGQIVEELFMDEANFDYVDKLADIFNIVVKNIHKSTLCTKLIWEIGMYHCCLDLRDGYFELMKETLLDTLKENMQPSLTDEQIEAWKKFIGVMFDIVHETFLLNSWPLREKIGLKKTQELDLLSDTTVCSDDYFLYAPSLPEEIEHEGMEFDDQYGVCGQLQSEDWKQLYVLDEDEIFEQDLAILELQTDEETLVE